MVIEPAVAERTGFRKAVTYPVFVGTFPGGSCDDTAQAVRAELAYRLANHRLAHPNHQAPGWSQ